MEIDVLYASYRSSYLESLESPFVVYRPQLKAFEAFRDSLVAKYGKDMIALRAEALTDSERAYVQELISHAVNLT